MNTRSVASARGTTGSNSARADAVVDDAHEPARRADLAAEHVGAIGALEQEQSVRSISRRSVVR